jgi:hypothetical protein
MKKLTLLVLLFSCLFTQAQQNLIPIQDFYKDNLFRPDLQKNLPSSFLPRSEGEFDLLRAIRDSSVQYYEITERIYKHHLVEIEGDGYQLNLSPIMNIALGKDMDDTSGRKFFDNTRGYLMELDIYDKLSFSSQLYENQNRFLDYQRAYYMSMGERYPKEEGYRPENGVVPGAARTKPFKGDGFDYGYAVGNVIYAPSNKLRFMMGNNRQFVGYGHRSLFLSDNAVPSSYFRTDIKFHPRWDYSIMRSKTFNLLRRPNRTTVEAYYEPKLFSSHYLSWNVHPNLRLSLFEGSYWNVGDSISSRRVNGGYFVPLPFLANSLVGDENMVSSINGLEVAAEIKGILFYTQLSARNWSADNFGFQLGMRKHRPFKWKKAFLQIEYNSVPAGVYEAKNRRLSYSAYNVSSAHIKGSGFSEYIFRFEKEHKRLYASMNVNFYNLYAHKEGSLLALYDSIDSKTGSILLVKTEAGVRLNKKINLQLFIRHIFRQSSVPGEIQRTNGVFGGISTTLFNQTNDF